MRANRGPVCVSNEEIPFSRKPGKCNFRVVDAEVSVFYMHTGAETYRGKRGTMLEEKKFLNRSQIFPANQYKF